MYPKIYDLSKYHHPPRFKNYLLEDAFKCMHCQAHVYTQPCISGVQNRNHCPYCLYSRHVDHAHAGDRMSACKAIMQPVGLTVKRNRNKYVGLASGELMLIHRCAECGKLSINRIAADDVLQSLMEVFYRSFEVDATLRQQLVTDEIHMLHMADLEMVLCQLQGCSLT